MLASILNLIIKGLIKTDMPSIRGLMKLMSTYDYSQTAIHAPESFIAFKNRLY